MKTLLAILISSALYAATPVTTTLTADLSSTERTLSLSSVDSLSPMTEVMIEDEQVLVCSVNKEQKTALACSYGRGRAGTTPVLHHSGTKVLINPVVKQDASGNVSVGTTVLGPGQGRNVMDSGAKCDGTTDDTAAIQTALDQLYADGGGTLWLPAGQICLANKQITNPNDGTPHNQVINVLGPFSRGKNIRIASTQNQIYGDRNGFLPGFGGGLKLMYDVTSATATATVSGGAVTGVTSLVGGAHTGICPVIEIYASALDTITAGAYLTPVCSSGTVQSVTLSAGGAGYNHAPTLVFNYGGKIQSFGFAVLEFDHVSIFDTGSSISVPDIYVTGTVLRLHDSSILSDAKTHDAIVLGGPDPWFNGTLNSPLAAYQGYGSIIKNNYFWGFTHKILARTFVEHLVIEGNYFDFGGNANGGMVTFTNAGQPPGVQSCASNKAGNSQIRNNNFELSGSKYGIELVCVAGTTIDGNDVEDSMGGVPVNFVHVDNTSASNHIFVTSAAGLATPVVDPNASDMVIDTTGGAGSFTRIPAFSIPAATITALSSTTLQASGMATVGQIKTTNGAVYFTDSTSSNPMLVQNSTELDVKLGDQSALAGFAAGYVKVGTAGNWVYRCVTAGTLPVGALTIDPSSCGTNVMLSFKVN